MAILLEDKVTREEERIFSATNYFRQRELFPSVSDEEIMHTIFYLKRYRELSLRVKDYEDHKEEMKLALIEGESARRLSSEELYANKTSNAVILYADTKPSIYTIQRAALDMIVRAHNLVIDPEEKMAVKLRYLDGYRYKDCLGFFKAMSPRTFDRRLSGGIFSIANSLKFMNFFAAEK